MTTLDSLRASATAKPDQIKLYGIIAEAAVALQHIAENIKFREMAAPGSRPNERHIDNARVLAEQLFLDLTAFMEKTR